MTKFDFDTELADAIAAKMIERDINMNRAKADLKDIDADVSDIEEWMHDLEEDFADDAAEYIDYYVNQMEYDDLIDYLKPYGEDKINDKIADLTTDECINLKELEENDKWNADSILRDIVYYGLTEVDYLNSNTFRDEILDNFSGGVFYRLGSDEQKDAYYNYY